MDQRNEERRGNQPEFYRNPHPAPPNWPSDDSISRNNGNVDNHRRNFPGHGNHYNRRQHPQHHHRNPNFEQNFGGPFPARKRPFDQTSSGTKHCFRLHDCIINLSFLICLALLLFVSEFD